MSSDNHEVNEVVTELREQGLSVTVYSASNDTWWVRSNGVYISYLATGAELLQLKSADKLNIRGIKSLG
jgi:hypothetical protein